MLSDDLGKVFDLPVQRHAGDLVGCPRIVDDPDDLEREARRRKRDVLEEICAPASRSDQEDPPPRGEAARHRRLPER